MNLDYVVTAVQSGEAIVVRVLEKFCEEVVKDIGLSMKPNLLAKITGVTKANKHGYDFVFDYSDFVAENQKIDPSFNIHEETFFLASETDFSEYFDALYPEYQSLHDLYKKESSGESYLRWLENTILGIKIKFK